MGPFVTLLNIRAMDNLGRGSLFCQAAYSPIGSNIICKPHPI